MKNSCSIVSKLLEKYFDQEVTDEERSLVNVHLLECDACQSVLNSMEKLRNLVKAPVEEALKKEDFPWVWQKIERGIRLEEKRTFRETFRTWLQIPSFSQRKTWIPAVVAISIVLILTIPLLFKKSSSYPSPSVVEYVESLTNNVMVYESEDTKVTVIWLFEDPEREATSS
jgi:anti-sigma-K factor RskA